MFDTMTKPQKSSHDDRLQTPSIPGIVNGLTIARIGLNARRIKHRGRKLKDGPLLNALVAWFLDQTGDEQARIAREGLVVFEGMLGSVALDDSAPGVSATAEPTVRPEIQPKRDHPARKKRGRPER